MKLRHKALVAVLSLLLVGRISAAVVETNRVPLPAAVTNVWNNPDYPPSIAQLGVEQQPAFSNRLEALHYQRAAQRLYLAQRQAEFVRVRVGLERYEGRLLNLRAAKTNGFPEDVRRDLETEATHLMEAIVYLVSAYAGGGSGMAIKGALFLILPMAWCSTPAWRASPLNAPSLGRWSSGPNSGGPSNRSFKGERRWPCAGAEPPGRFLPALRQRIPPPAGDGWPHFSRNSRIPTTNLRTPFRQVAVFQNGRCASLNKPVPKWLEPLLP